MRCTEVSGLSVIVNKMLFKLLLIQRVLPEDKDLANESDFFKFITNLKNYFVVAAVSLDTCSNTKIVFGIEII